MNLSFFCPCHLFYSDQIVLACRYFFFLHNCFNICKKVFWSYSPVPDKISLYQIHNMCIHMPALTEYSPIIKGQRLRNGRGFFQPCTLFFYCTTPIRPFLPKSYAFFTIYCSVMPPVPPGAFPGLFSRSLTHSFC